MPAKRQLPPTIELHPDAWERFERAAGVVAKTPPQHRAAKKKKVKKISSRKGSTAPR
jgi:hypothetical protein